MNRPNGVLFFSPYHSNVCVNVWRGSGRVISKRRLFHRVFASPCIFLIQCQFEIRKSVSENGPGERSWNVWAHLHSILCVHLYVDASLKANKFFKIHLQCEKYRQLMVLLGNSTEKCDIFIKFVVCEGFLFWTHWKFWRGVYDIEVNDLYVLSLKFILKVFLMHAISQVSTKAYRPYQFSI